jgi:phosphoadenosine phosphosulfate reductase
MAGVKYDTHFNFTTVDPPQVLKYIKKYYPDVEWNRPKMTMWELIAKKGILPTRTIRYCCEYLKEYGGDGRFVVTGIRSAESEQRSHRKMIEFCYKNKGKKFLHPIIDWSVRDVWQFIGRYELPYCELYDMGFKRIGCVLCPKQYYKHKQKEAIMFPNFVKAYKQAIKNMIETRKQKGLKQDLGVDEQFDWWIAR